MPPTAKALAAAAAVLVTTAVYAGACLRASLDARADVMYPGNQYHVATTGSDSSGDGTAAHPWATIGYAADHAQLATDGATVHVAAGTYRTIVHNTASGRAGAYLTFVSDDTWGAKTSTERHHRQHGQRHRPLPDCVPVRAGHLPVRGR